MGHADRGRASGRSRPGSPALEWDVSFRVPPGQLGLIAVLAVVGVVAAIAPARRGARIDVLSAIRND